jgi:transcriptional regulator with XRE-family HTH domain
LVVQTKIADYIVTKGLKKCHVAKEAGISVNRFSQIVNNHSELKADEYERICQALQVSPVTFLEDPTVKTE